MEDSVCAKIAHTATDGKTYNVRHHNLDMIIAVGLVRFKTYKGEILPRLVTFFFVLCQRKPFYCKTLKFRCQGFFKEKFTLKFKM